MATMRPASRNRLTTLLLSSGRILGFDLRDAETLGDRARCRPVIAGQHDHCHAIIAERLQCVRRCGFDRIGDAENTGDRAIHGDEYRRRSLFAQPLGFVLERTRS